MPFTFTPRHLQKRAELYHQLGQMTAAGISIVSTLEMLARNPPSRSDRQPLSQLLAGLRDGDTFSGALRRPRGWLPSFDIAMLHAGEQSGRLPECFRLLDRHYDERARLARQVISDLTYPVALLHFAVFLFPFASFFLSGNWGLYLFQTLGLLLPLYAVVLLGVFAMQGRHGEQWREIMERLLHPIPVLGAARRSLALARLAAALEALLSAGVTVIEAWEIAALACGSPVLRRRVASWVPRLRAGQTPSEAVSGAGEFPEIFANLYRSGEISGKLDESLRNLHRYFQEEGSRKLHLLTQWMPRLVYLVIALAIAFKIVSFYMGYFKKIGEVIPQ